jgi:hypothetical protein
MDFVSFNRTCCFFLLIASPNTPTIDEIMQELSKFLFCFLILWIIGFGLVWGLYRLKRGRAKPDKLINTP